MYLLDQKTVGIVLLVLLGMLVIVKQLATGSIIEMPTGSRLLRLTNSFNLFFLLVVNPLAAILLITGNANAIDPTHMAVSAPRLAQVGAGVVTLARQGGDPVLARQGSVLVATFHPELTDDPAVHRYFCEMVRRHREAGG